MGVVKGSRRVLPIAELVEKPSPIDRHAPGWGAS